MGPHTGGTLLTVIGANFVNFGAQMMCRFGTLATSPATYLTASTVECVLPPGPVGGVVVEVANNGQDFSRSGIVFTYYRTHSLGILVVLSFVS